MAGGVVDGVLEGVLDGAAVPVRLVPDSLGSAPFGLVCHGIIADPRADRALGGGVLGRRVSAHQ
ncbi:hypothetical protein [Actinomadura chibensis]|uniref:hypothetical protein n=1 Tax=Actinomadura chibensis TaxID=392828 RepID=UPI000A9B688D|nr:hypothetical protein [Actinomadura chibensis]